MTQEPTPSIRVALVDDHELVRVAVRSALEADDFVVVAEADTAAAALDVIPATRPDVVLLDLGLPDMAGVDLLRELTPRVPLARIVMLTATSDDEDLVRAMRYGAAGYLTKDLGPAALRRAVRGVMLGDLPMSRHMAARLVRRLLDAARRGSEGVESLTDREREVLRLIAEGMTNRQIAARLVVSPRTAEAHVRKILKKLDVRNRAQAVRHLVAPASSHELGMD